MKHKHRNKKAKQKLGKIETLQGGSVIIRRLEGQAVRTEMHDDFSEYKFGGVK